MAWIFFFYYHRQRLILMEINRVFPEDCELLLVCKETKDFLFEGNEGTMSGHNINPGLCIDPPSGVPDCQETKVTKSTTRKRKRNQVKDKLRTEAEQTAYKKLKQIIPSLRGCKRVTKLETIRQACLYIEKMQETLTCIRG